MKKPIQISVPQPCHEDWNQMAPQEQGRFCDACKKCVTDFTQMSDAQLYRFMKTHEGEKVCGRFRVSQLHRPIIAPQQPHSKLYHWAIAAGLALCFTALPHSYAKTFPYPTEQTTNQQQPDTTDTFSISGRVIDEHKEPVMGAIVLVKNAEGINIGGAATDYEGNFVIKPLNREQFKGGNILMEVFYMNYKKWETVIDPEKIASTYNIKLEIDPKAVENYEIIILGGVGLSGPLVEPLPQTEKPLKKKRKK